MEEPPDVYSRALAPEQLHEQEWQKILALVSPLTPGQADLIILPEGVAPYSADSPLFKASHLKGRWKAQITMPNRFLSSIDLAQMVATTVRARVLIGLEGRGVDSTGEVTAYNSCFFIPPSPHNIMRYDKQLLLPLGEYIPFSFLRSYLASYGIHDSFSPGKCPVLFNEGGFRLSPLICYEETFSSYAVAASRLQPNLLVTLSNDCWYPSVRREHFELARLRTVEMGIPLVRSCNQGVSGAVDAIGRTVGCQGLTQEAKNGCTVLALSQYTRCSPYMILGAHWIALLLAMLAATFLYSRLTPKPQ